ncbi:MAG: hypothetical protein AAF394_09485, partial [Planctomycetota bacterium]
IEEAVERVETAIYKLIRKHDGGRVGLVVPQPMASIVRFVLLGGSLGDLWKCELDFGNFETLQIESVPSSSLFARV